MNLEQLEAYRINEPITNHNGIPMETWEKLTWSADNPSLDKTLRAREAQAILRALNYAKNYNLRLFRDETIRDLDDKSTSYRAWFRPKEVTEHSSYLSCQS